MLNLFADFQPSSTLNISCYQLCRAAAVKRFLSSECIPAECLCLVCRHAARYLRWKCASSCYGFPRDPVCHSHTSCNVSAAPINQVNISVLQLLRPAKIFACTLTVKLQCFCIITKCSWLVHDLKDKFTQKWKFSHYVLDGRWRVGVRYFWCLKAKQCLWRRLSQSNLTTPTSIKTYLYIFGFVWDLLQIVLTHRYQPPKYSWFCNWNPYIILQEVNDDVEKRPYLTIQGSVQLFGSTPKVNVGLFYPQNQTPSKFYGNM